MEKIADNTTAPFLGILMLDTQFPRPIGDIGNPETFSFPVRKAVIEKAFPANIILANPKKLLPEFINAALKLQSEGAKIITTSCGFLTPFQRDLQNALSIPVMTSSLLMYQEITAKLPEGKRLGIMTISGSTLTDHHLAAAEIRSSPPIATMENSKTFYPAIIENKSTMEFDKARDENIAAAIALKHQNTDLGGILLECTNMPPYQSDIQKAIGLPVYSIVDGINTLWARS